MKGAMITWCCCTLILLTRSASGQTCANPTQTIVYQNTAIGSGNADVVFSVPMFDPTLGTLMNIKFESEITLLYTFELENQETVAINNYRVRVNRDDEVSGDALMNPLTTTFQKTYGPYPLAARDGTFHGGPDYTTKGPLFVMNHSLASQMVYNTADFLGNGSNDFVYTTTTYSSILGSVNYTFNATATDTVRFTVTYTYCSSFFLKADLASFTAARTGSVADIQWTTQNEERERIYEIQAGYDGRSFQPVARVKSAPGANDVGNYRYQYTLPAGARGKLCFRLKEIEKDATEKYSIVRVIDLGKAVMEDFRVYPNPSKGCVNMVFSDRRRDDWHVDIFTATGTLVAARDFAHALVAKLNNDGTLPRGAYFIRAYGRNTGATVTRQFIIQ